MTLRELKAQLDHDLANHPELADNEVAIEIKTNEPTFGPTPCVLVDYLYHGFDWDSGHSIFMMKRLDKQPSL